MPNKWVEHVKQYAKKKGLSYGCAVTDPGCKSSYHAGKDVPPLETPMRTSRVIKARPPKETIKIRPKPKPKPAPRPTTPPPLPSASGAASGGSTIGSLLVGSARFKTQQPKIPKSPSPTRDEKEMIDKYVEDAIKDIYYEEFPDFMKGTVSREKLYKDKFLTLSKKKQDDLRERVRQRVITQLRINEGL